uniref:DNA replication factor Cdt1-like n=1 Tax=Oncorhynchus gorbuscha TaxID=8017 RepID=UPI001EAEEA78|nr:DNA replication factor Cdt1-like [Oncorhynchus gorbuscha]
MAEAAELEFYRSFFLTRRELCGSRFDIIMSQARVTDFYVQRKKDASGAAHGDGNLKQVVDTVTSHPSTISTLWKSKNAASTTNVMIKTSCYENSVQEEFWRVIDEATSVNKVESVSPVLARTNSEKQTLFSSPRTPKRTSTDAEFDLGSAVFSATADHKIAKKRLRIEARKHGIAAGTSPGPVKVVKKAVRKKLILFEDDEKATQPLAKDVLQVPYSPLPVDKESNNFVNCSANHSPTGKPHVQGSSKPKEGHKTFSKEDVVALKFQLQKIKDQTRKAENLPSTATRSTAPDLKTKLARVKELAAKAQHRKAERLAEARSTEENNCPITEDGDKLPAYQRYHTLAQDTPPGLTLPFKYKLLAGMFRSMDTIVGMLFNRSETVTFAKVKQGVQDMMHKRFEETHVGQIKTVYPTAYHFRQERNIPTFSATVKKSSYQLTVEPVIEADKSKAVLAASRLLERRRIFHQNLINIVKGHHRAFLAKLNPPIRVPDDKLTRWHPHFNVDEVPNVLPGELPQPPRGAEKLTTAQEVLDKARSMMTPKVEKALANAVLKTAEMVCVKEQEPVPQTPVAPAETNSALKGVSQSLLERIRAKQAQKLQAALTRNPQQEERLVMMSRLEELARILRNVFVAEKKPALIMEVACNRMVSSYCSAMSMGDMELHLHLLAELTSEWLTIHTIRKDFYLKLNKTMDLNVVLEKLKQKTKEEESL